MIFVNRRQELETLEKSLKASLNNIQHILLLYGLRRVGKTSLIRKFISDKQGILVDCSEISHGAEFFTTVYAKILKLFGLDPLYQLEDIKTDPLRRFYPYFSNPLDDSFEMLKNTFDFLNEVAKETDYLIVALDEFHGLIENISKFSMDEKYPLAREKLLWTIRNKLQSSQSNILWILSTSAGFLVEEYSRANRAFLEMLKKIEIKPLSLQHSKEMAKKLLDRYEVNYDEDIVHEIAKLSGGIPALIEKICFMLIREKKLNKEALINTIKSALEMGEFDEFFYSYTNFIAENSRWSRPTILKVLRCIAEGEKNNKEISKKTKIKPTTLSNMLSDLRNKGVITKNNEITYPLYKEWLLAREIPPSGYKRIDLLLYNLGVTVESYIREIFSHINKKITLKGEDKYFYGTASELTINPIKSVKGGGEIDLIATENTGRKIIGEIKSGKVSKKDVENFHKKLEKIKGEKLAILIAMGGALPSAIAESAKRNIIILSKDAINEIAKKIGHPRIQY
ncbi:MAG: AAA family ATPase [Candidatus Njordarchaeia archaeon]